MYDEHIEGQASRQTQRQTGQNKTDTTIARQIDKKRLSEEEDKGVMRREQIEGLLISPDSMIVSTPVLQYVSEKIGSGEQLEVIRWVGRQIKGEGEKEKV